MFDDVPDPVWNTSIGNSAVVFSGRDRVAGGDDLSGQRRVDQAEFGVRLGGRRLDPTEPVDHPRRDRFAGDVEVVDRFGRLGTPEHLVTLPRLFRDSCTRSPRDVRIVDSFPEKARP